MSCDRCAVCDSHVYYVGGSNAGLMGIIDASEMVDTYGADADEVRGFLQGGWEAMGNHTGGSVRDRSVFCHISLEVWIKLVCMSFSGRQRVALLRAAQLCECWLHHCA